MLSPDFKEFIKSLNNSQVRYLIIGGYAVAAHGHPRYTKDLDVWVESTPENAARMVAALADFGFASLKLTETDFLEAGQVIQLGYPPNRIDLILTPKGIDFPTCYAAKLIVDLEGTPLHFIDLANLIANKKATGRPQDLADVNNLQP